MYQEFASKHPSGDISFTECRSDAANWLGVLHLKGFLFDNTLLYSGASLNNVYLHQQDRYRLDRYHQIQNADLARQLCTVDLSHFVNDAGYHGWIKPRSPVSNRSKQNNAVSAVVYKPVADVPERAQLAPTPISGGYPAALV